MQTSYGGVPCCRRSTRSFTRNSCGRSCAVAAVYERAPIRYATSIMPRVWQQSVATSPRAVFGYRSNVVNNRRSEKNSVRVRLQRTLTDRHVLSHYSGSPQTTRLAPPRPCTGARESARSSSRNSSSALRRTSSMQSMLAFAVRTVLESVREDKREDHPGRPDAYFLATDPTHFEEVFRAERSDLVAISSRLRFPVDARGNVTATGTSQRRCKRASFSLGYEMAAWLMVRCARRAPCLLLS